MLDIIFDKIKETVTSRVFAITMIYLVLVGGLIYRMFYLQIIHGEEYQKKYESSQTHTRAIKATRGNIYDKNGKLLAENVLTYSVIFQDYGKLTEASDINDMVANMIKLIEKNNDTIDVEFGLKLNDEGKIVYAVSGNKKKRFLKDAYSNEKLTDKELSVSAEDAYEFINYSTDTNSPKFNVDKKKYSKEMQFKITAIRYAMYMNRYSKYKQLTIASDVNEKTVAAIEENSADLKGVSIMEDTRRVYHCSTSMAHILGYTGSVGSTSLKEQGLDEEKYTSNDQIGKSGIEKEYEDYLHGTMGQEEVTLNNKKAITKIEVTKEPVAGKDVYLTIDADLQEATYKMLEEHIAGILLSKIEAGGDFSIKMTDVYYALLNNVIDVMKFSEKDASDLEKSIYNTYKHERSSVFDRLDTVLGFNSKENYNTLNKDYQDYTVYIYRLLGNKGVLLKDKIDKNDATYKKYVKDKISLSEFLQYAISKEWIDRSKFSDTDGYYSSEEIYAKMIQYTKKLLKNDSTFNKKVYKNLVASQKITGTQISLLLFEQGVIKYNKDEVAKLKSGAISASSFIRGKIKKLKITPGQLGLDPSSGSVVVTDSNSGEVRAMVSYPGYDNNKLANKIDADYYSLLTTSTASPLINRPVQQRTAPGSTYKLLTSVAGLTEGVITPSTTFNCTGKFDKFAANNPACWRKSGHGKLNVVGGIKNSCNVFFYNVGWKLSLVNGKYNSNVGLKKLKKYAEMFGFDAPSGVGFGEYQPKISDEYSVPSAIGQGTNAYTPTQINRYTDAVANKGTVYDLSIVDKIKTSSGKVVKNFNSKVHNKITTVADSTWSLVHQGAYQVVNDSNLKGLFSKATVEVAGKTGTAQEQTTRPDHALFTSFAPYDNPKVAVTAVIPHGYTSSYAAEIAGKVYQYMYPEPGTKKKHLIKNEAVTPKASASHD
ncbi:cell division protein FtsI [peptidoglycan synthetase] [Lachnospiraceae bacterium KM106-2]|nr:cell division protein FtsI [peptidoglycan synthetase] [Lachnospiraceae bacterium KM106-2]